MIVLALLVRPLCREEALEAALAEECMGGLGGPMVLREGISIAGYW